MLTRTDVVVLATVLLAATPFEARAREHVDPFEAMQNPKVLLRGAMLTDAQVARIRELRKAQWDETEALQKRAKLLWDEFNDKFTSTDAVDVAELTALAAEAEKLHAEGELAKVKIMFQIRALLTPEQLARVSQTRQKMKSLDAQTHALEPTIAAEKER